MMITVFPPTPLLRLLNNTQQFEPQIWSIVLFISIKFSWAKYLICRYRLNFLIIKEEKKFCGRKPDKVIVPPDHVLFYREDKRNYATKKVTSVMAVLLTIRR